MTPGSGVPKVLTTFGSGWAQCRPQGAGRGFRQGSSVSGRTQPPTFAFQPIAFVQSPYSRRIDAPHQSTVVQGTESGDAAEAILREAEDDLVRDAMS